MRGCFELYMRKMCMIILLTTYVWPSIWGWKVVDLVSLVSSIDQRLDQNALRNLMSRSKTMDYGIPKCTHTSSKKSLAVASAMILFLQAAMMAILESVDDHKNAIVVVLSRRKAQHVVHETDSQGQLSLGRGVYKTCFLMISLAMT